MRCAAFMLSHTDNHHKSLPALHLDLAFFDTSVRPSWSPGVLQAQLQCWKLTANLLRELSSTSAWLRRPLCCNKASEVPLSVCTWSLYD